MANLPRELYTAAQVRQFDQRAIEVMGVDSYGLMLRAGQAAFSSLRNRWPFAQRVLIVCGAGNNGGDGLVVARLAHDSGLDVSVVLLADANKFTGAAANAWRDYRAASGVVSDNLAGALAQAEVVVDAIFGIGLDRPVKDNEYAAIKSVNDSRRPILALDIPSGLHADRGVALGIAVNATLTLSFIALKQGLFTGQARHHCGEVRLADLGVPAQVLAETQATALRFGVADIRGHLAPRSRVAHKGDNGFVAVLGGDEGMAGAACLAGMAAARAGAGWVCVATQPAHVAVVVAQQPELLCRGVTQRSDVQAIVARADVIAVGPGLGKSAWSQLLWNCAYDTATPLIVDADALNLLAVDPARRDNWILTPHPGEAARLLQCDVASIEQDRYAAVTALQQRYGGVCVLKGAGTLIANGRDPIVVIETGNPGMASGGMGDVLTGVIAALLAQGLSLSAAANVGAALHGAAGDAAAVDGERGMLASDLLPKIRRLVNAAP